MGSTINNLKILQSLNCKIQGTKTNIRRTKQMQGFRDY